MAGSLQDSKEIFFRRVDELDELALEDDGEVQPESASQAVYHYSDSIRQHDSRPSKQELSNPHMRSASSPRTTGLNSLAPSKEIMTSKRRSRSGKVPPKLSKRQSSKKSLRLQPEEAQVFRGLTFYFLPNNDIAMARKKRIEKAQEYGATWATEWSTDVTHVIADENLRMSDVRKAVGSDKLEPHHVIVNETYPPDCIKYQALLPTHFIRYQVASDVLQSGLAAEQQHRLAPAGYPVSRSRAESAVPGNASSAAKADDEHQKPGIKGREPSSLGVEEDLGHRVAVKNLEGPEGDELEKIVAEVQETADLPLDSEDESFEPSSNMSLSDSDDNRQTRMQGKKQKRSTADNVDAKPKFSCMRKNESASKVMNPNAGTIEKLENMAHYYDRIGDHWRTMSYRKCITALKRQSVHITTRQQAVKIPGIGERLATKVEEIACTSRLRRLESVVLDTNDQLLQLFMGIYQVGLPTASRWIAQGHKSLEDLKHKADLTPNQKIGIDHYIDFSTRIPRSEVSAHASIVRKACAEADPEIQLVVGGSYRRGAADCGDIDLIITKENASLESIRTILVDTVIPQLFKEGFLKVGLATSSSRSKDHGSKWHGASALLDSRVWRRIDLLFVPWDEFGAALIYFTGNDIFNRSIRLLASRKGMRLNQHGLYGDVMRGEKRERITQGTLLEGRSEERIFQILGVPWRPPEHRIC